MSMGSGSTSPKTWRPWERCGWAVGIGAGVIVLLSLWIFSITSQIAGLMHSVARKKRPL